MSNTSLITSTEQTKKTFELWDQSLPFPDYQTMQDPDVITHVQVQRGKQGEYHYLHESMIAWHRNRLFIGFANHPTHEENIKDELIRGCVSDDGGMSFDPATTWMPASVSGSCAFNIPVMVEKDDCLWGFFTRWEKDVKFPRTEVFQFDDTDNNWLPIDANIPAFMPFSPPIKMRDGNWIMAGEYYWFDAAVAISHGDDWSKWEMVVIPKPDDLDFLFPESTVIDQGDRLVNFCRPKLDGPSLVSTSTDCGRTWDLLRESNFPIARSKPLAGTLSTGQNYLITNHVDQVRALLTIAMTEPGGKAFKKMLKVRHQQTPHRRLFKSGNWYDHDTGKSGTWTVGKETEWTYPAAVEHDGKLYISYTQGKEDCALSIIPVCCLEDEQ